MKHTVFSTPIIAPCLRALARLLLKLSRWKVVAEDLPAPPYVVIAAPHTSNWDFPLMLMCLFKLKMNVNWMGKDTLFRKPFGTVAKWFGGIPIDRSEANNVVNQTVQEFAQDPQLVVIIPPEGARHKVSRWKTGFYHIAHQAGVPIFMTAIDGANKELRFVGMYETAGDIDKDLPEIQQLLAGVQGIVPEHAWDYPD